MHPIAKLLLALALLAGTLCAGQARAETFNTCAGFITSLPATISTQGVWCLNKNLSTAITSGNAITIATNNVTIDCNDFKIGGLAAGNGSDAIGIRAASRQNATIRHCNVRGFAIGIELDGGAGHLVEDNRLDNNLFMAISVTGDNYLVQRNRVYDTGGKTGSFSSYGISASADIVDNTVSGLFADEPDGFLIGIITETATGTQVRGNRVSGFDMLAVQDGSVDEVYGIYLTAPYQRASGNQVTANAGGSVNGYGIGVLYASDYCLDNTVGGFTTNISSGCNSSGNLTAP